ncbi:hypothetical protein ASE26_25525 [Duganella sp. Root198D2]|nr:hypothetical protein ASE26_25525 [Duganella sp. Root198D2]
MYLAKFEPMLTTRLFMWPILAASYGALIAATIHTLLGNWSGAASLGMLFAVFVGTPTLVGYAGYLWRKNRLRGLARIEAALCVMLPIAILLLIVLAIKLGR